MNTELLKQAGIDYDKGVERFLGDFELYEMILKHFLEDDNLERVEQSYESRDYQLLQKQVHEVKGMSGNTDMTLLYQSSSALVELLRRGGFEESELKKAYERYKSDYTRAVNGIKESI